MGGPCPLPPTCPPRFPSDLLLTSSSGELWRMVRIGGQPLGFGESRFLQGQGGDCGVTTVAGVTTGILLNSDECGIVAQIAGPLATADVSAYYISTFNFDHALVSSALGWGLGGKLRPRRVGGEGGGSRWAAKLSSPGWTQP
jgi:hypothetical protein